MSEQIGAVPDDSPRYRYQLRGPTPGMRYESTPLPENEPAFAAETYDLEVIIGDAEAVVRMYDRIRSLNIITKTAEGFLAKAVVLQHCSVEILRAGRYDVPGITRTLGRYHRLKRLFIPMSTGSYEVFVERLAGPRSRPQHWTRPQPLVLPERSPMKDPDSAIIDTRTHDMRDRSRTRAAFIIAVATLLVSALVGFVTWQLWPSFRGSKAASAAIISLAVGYAFAYRRFFLPDVRGALK